MSRTCRDCERFGDICPRHEDIAEDRKSGLWDYDDGWGAEGAAADAVYGRWEQ
jgi:hypothetical protein